MWTNLLYVMLGSAVGGGCRFLVSKVVTEHTQVCFLGAHLLSISLAAC